MVIHKKWALYQSLIDEEIKNSFVGKNAGDEIIFDIKKAYPNDTEIAYLLNIEKKDAENVSGNFKFTVKEINKFVAAELTEEHYKKILGEETQILTAEAFREHVANELSVYYKPSADYKLAIDARELLINKIKMEFPEGFLKRWLLATNKELTQEQIDADFEPFMEDLRWQVIKENIIKENELKVSQEDVMELAKDIAASQFRQYGMFDIPEEHLQGFARQCLKRKTNAPPLQQKMEDKVIEVINQKSHRRKKGHTKNLESCSRKIKQMSRFFFQPLFFSKRKIQNRRKNNLLKIITLFY